MASQSNLAVFHQRRLAPAGKPPTHAQYAKMKTWASYRGKLRFTFIWKTLHDNVSTLVVDEGDETVNFVRKDT